MLKIENLTKQFGGLTAVRDVSVTFEKGKINAIIGPNGAGKTTFFNLISGMHQPTSGRIIFKGVDVTRMRADQVARLGVARTFQTTHLFDNATVFDNLIVGHRLRTKSGFWDVVFNTKRLREEEKACRKKAEEVLEFVGLNHAAYRLAGDISQEERKRVAFALALATEPDLVLLDEPAGGVNLTMLADLKDRLTTYNAEHGTTFVVIEHNMEFVMSLCTRIIVLAEGAVIAEGTPEEIRANQTVIDAYLGG